VLHHTALNTLSYSTLHYATPFHSTLLYSTLLYSTLLYSTLLYSTLLYSTLLYSTLLYSTLLKFRISNHSLAIETGRYNNQNNPNDQRICPFCSNNKVGTEIHMLCNCSLYNDIRQTFFDLLESEIHINNFRDPNTICDLLKSTNEKVLLYLSKFIYKCFILKNESQ